MGSSFVPDVNTRFRQIQTGSDGLPPRYRYRRGPTTSTIWESKQRAETAALPRLNLSVLQAFHPNALHRLRPRHIHVSTMSSSHPPPHSTRGLDHMNNPIMDDGLGARLSDEALAAVEPIRDVDWHAGPQEIVTLGRRRAAHGQRCGMVAPPGQACHRCTHGKRVFSTCVVNKVDGALQSKGSCMNCDWLGESSRCSFRKFPPSPSDILVIETDKRDNSGQSPSLPGWVLEYANTNGQVQPAVTSSNHEAVSAWRKENLMGEAC